MYDICLFADILYNGGKLMDDMAVKSATFRPMNVITVVKLDRNPEPRVDIAEAAGNIKGKIPQTALALRTAFLNPKFIPTIMVYLIWTNMMRAY